jgi:hypothetical protein
MRDFAGAGFYAFAAARAFLGVYRYGAGCFIYAERFEGAGFDARVILTLGAQVWKFRAGYKHEDADSGGFWPDFVFVAQGAGDFAFSTTAAL